MAHPRQYDRESVVPAICERLAKGEPLAAICRDMGIPRRTVNQWRKDDAEIAAQFDEARDDGYDSIAAYCLEIADDSRNDWMTIKRGGHEIEVPDREVVDRSKLRVETRLKLLAKWDPRRYGDRMALTGPDGGAIKLETLVTTDQAAAVLQEGLRALEKPGSGS